MFRCIIFTVLLALSTSGFGQTDPEAEPFLEGVRLVAPRVPVRALDYTLCSIS